MMLESFCDIVMVTQYCCVGMGWLTLLLSLLLMKNTVLLCGDGVATAVFLHVCYCDCDNMVCKIC
jgi:hypothetical protein